MKCTPFTDSQVPASTSTKLQEVCAALTQLAKQAGPSGGLPSVSQLRDQLNVSTSTLHQALVELDRRGVIIREQGRGLFASPGLRQKTVGVLFGTDPHRVAQSPFYLIFLDEIRNQLTRQSYGLEIYVDLPYGPNMGRARRQLYQDIVSGQIDGILVPAASDKEQIDWLLEQRVPCVYSTHTESDPGYHIEFDFSRLIHQAVRALSKRGCKQIGLIDHSDRDHVERSGNRHLDAFKRSLSGQRLAYHPQRSKQYQRNSRDWREPTSPTHEELGYQAILELWSRFDGSNSKHAPDGLIITDDMLTRGAIAGLHRLGLYPGRDIQIATHVNTGSPVLANYVQDLISVELNVAEFADIMLTTLEQLTQGTTPPPRHQLIESRVIATESAVTKTPA